MAHAGTEEEDGDERHQGRDPRETQQRREGFSFVEVLTMCPTGWFIPTGEGPDYLSSTLAEVHIMGELKVDGVIRTTEELHAENVARAAELEAQLARGGLES